MEPDSRGLACTVSPFFGEDWAPPVHRARRGPVGTSARNRTVLRAGGSRNGPGEQGSAPSSAQLSPIPVSSDPVWRPVAPAGPRGCGLCGSEPLRLRQPHGVKPSQRTPPHPPCVAPALLSGGPARPGKQVDRGPQLAVGVMATGRLCYGTSQGECLLLVTHVSPSVLPCPGAGAAGGRPQSHSPGFVSVPKCPVLL